MEKFLLRHTNELAFYIQKDILPFLFFVQKVALADESRVKEVLSRSSELCNISDVNLRRKPKCVELDCPNLNKQQILADITEHALGIVLVVLDGVFFYLLNYF